MKNIIVIGGGASGMISAISCSKNNKVLLLEKNEKLGKKIYITGKGRGNISNNCEKEDFFKAISSNSKFMFSSFNFFSNKLSIDFFNKIGLETVVERGGRVFPRSNHASDITKYLEKELVKKGVEIKLGENVKEIKKRDKEFLVKTSKGEYKGDKVIIATGGLSYPLTGSTGDGYKFGKAFGHEVVECMPSLVDMIIEDDYKSLAGLSLKNIRLVIKKGKKEVYNNIGELLFTHEGISGPLVLTATSRIGKNMIDGEYKVYLDLKEALSREVIENKIKDIIDKNKNKLFRNAFSKLLPRSLEEKILELSCIDKDKECNSILREEREVIVNLIKEFPINVKELGGFNRAVITKGGISVKEINPKTMESKLVEGLYFVGEVLDVDAVTGGYNLQIAWTTGYTGGFYAGIN